LLNLKAFDLIGMKDRKMVSLSWCTISCQNAMYRPRTSYGVYRCCDWTLRRTHALKRS